MLIFVSCFKFNIRLWNASTDGGVGSLFSTEEDAGAGGARAGGESSVGCPTGVVPRPPVLFKFVLCG